MTEGVGGPKPIQPSQQQQQGKQASGEDVQQYIKIQEQMNQLESVLNVAQSMVQSQLQKAREEGKHVAFNFETIPSTGNSEERGNIGTFNALQPVMATEIQSLSTRTALLKADDPSSADTYNGFLDQLEDISKSFPQLSQKQIDTLNTISQTLHEKVNQADIGTQIGYWNEAGDMYDKMMTLTGSSIKDSQAQTAQLKTAQAPKEEIEGSEKVTANLGSFQEKAGAARAGASNKATESGGGLQHAFQHAILGKYMPSQEKYLQSLAELLMFDNMGAQMGNALLQLMTDFQAAGTNYDLNNSLHSSGKKTKDGKTIYSGETASQVNAQISKEKNQANSDLKSIKQALAKIQSQIKSIENNPNLTKSQKNKLINGKGGLKDIQSGLKASEKQVSKLADLLSHMKATSDGTKKFTISGPKGWSSELPAYESIVQNGASASEAKKWGLPEGGGLNKVAGMVNTFQQSYADQGQNQQMILQMRMTEIQQEWSVVSTAEQQLNQMFMSVAQGIYK